MKFISPNELHTAACDIMLCGHLPSTDHDWMLVVNFWAANVTDGHESICKLMAMMYECPLDDAAITKIAAFQAAACRKAAR